MEFLEENWYLILIAVVFVLSVLYCLGVIVKATVKSFEDRSCLTFFNVLSQEMAGLYIAIIPLYVLSLPIFLLLFIIFLPHNLKENAGEKKRLAAKNSVLADKTYQNAQDILAEDLGDDIPDEKLFLRATAHLEAKGISSSEALENLKMLLPDTKPKNKCSECEFLYVTSLYSCPSCGEPNEKALAIQEKKFGPEHPIIAACCNSLAKAYQEKGNHRKAVDFYSKSLALKLKEWGPKHPDIAICYKNLGRAHAEARDQEQALEYLLKAKEMFIKRVGFSHAETIETQYWIRKLERPDSKG
jgi:tetratricopeptide (TPR) repeat protein